LFCDSLPTTILFFHHLKMLFGYYFKNVCIIAKDEVCRIFGDTKWLPLLTALTVLSSNIGPIPRVPYIHVPFILLCILHNLGRHWSVEKVCIVFLLYLPLNIIITNPDPVFQSWSRMCFFALVIFLASPMFIGEYIAGVRKKTLISILFLSLLLSVGSFICYFLGINYMTNQFDGSDLSAEKYMGSAGAFGGLTNQSIVLGLFSGISTMYMFYRSICNPKRKIFYWSCMGVTMLSLLFAASRSGLLSTVAGLLVMLYQKNENKVNFIKVLFAIVIGAMLTFPLWESATDGIVKKQEGNQKIEGKYGSRSTKWEARMVEFAGSPVFGVGFAAQDPNGNDSYNIKTGTVEPGSSWLCILSMTGIIGFILVLLMLIRPFLYLKRHPSPYNTLLLGLFVFFMVAFISEGYIFAGGSALCFTAWLVFGCANDVKEGYVEDDGDEDGDEDDNDTATPTIRPTDYDNGNERR